MSTPTPPPGPNRPVGATPIGARDDDRGRKKKGLLWGALALLGLVVIALLLSQCGGDDPQSSSSSGSTSPSSSSTQSSSSASESSSASSSSSSSSSSAPDSAGAGSGDGSIVAGDQSVLELVAGGSAGALADLDGQDATGTAVQVLSVPADEGFWVGSSESDRVWVQLTGQAGESPYQVQEGDTVDFTGTVATHEQGFAEEVGVSDAEGAAQLTEQGAHIEVPKSEVQLSK